MKSAEQQMEILCQGAERVVTAESLRAKLERSAARERPLVVKLGLDPSAPDIHLGHTVLLRKLRQFQDLGHQAVVVIGDFTGTVGDPTGKSKGRAALSREQVQENARTYCDQIYRVLDAEKTRLCFNSEWLEQVNLGDVLRLAQTTTVARMLERDDFASRYQAQAPIGLHEFFYPLMQAYDSVALRADVELGGLDQTFNVLMGRTLQKAWGLERQAAIFMPLLTGLDGVQKMSKSLGNYIGVTEPAAVMFKKVMEVPDALIMDYYTLASGILPRELEQVRARLEAGENPRDLKYELACRITELDHGAGVRGEAEQYYRAAFMEKGTPRDMPELSVAPAETLGDCIALLVQCGYVKSKGEFLRLVRQKGVRLDGAAVQEADLTHTLQQTQVLKIGKKRFVALKR
ncbi:MAG: tyrosine--tRNA ligase [Clostridiales bacterium]|nr:tyrosine--tRNA ligase [Clostridiales bacterium]